MTITAWISALRAKSGTVLNNITNTQLLAYLNDAIILHRTYIRNRCRGTYTEKSEQTFAADGYNLTIPADMDDSVTALLYSNEHDINPINRLSYRIEEGQIQFYTEQKSGDSYWIKYTKQPLQYTAYTEEPIEFDAPDVKMLLDKEVTQTAISVEDDFDGTNAGNNLTSEANNIQLK